MKKIIIGLTLLSSISAYALPSDYICRVSEIDSSFTYVTGAARISRSVMKTSNGLTMILSNNMGYNLTLSVSDAKGNTLLSGDYKLVGIRDEQAIKNPFVIKFQSTENNLEAKCTRADNINY